MQYIDEYRDGILASGLLEAIGAAAERTGPVRVMEVCGGHTHTIYRHGIEALLPENVSLVHGPGCPVCVIPMGRIDDAIDLALRDGVILCCYGDLIRVPGNRRSLQDAMAEGADVRIVYSPLDVLEVAESHPDREVVFLAVGFETTAPATALTILEADRRGIPNVSFLVNHVRIAPALRALLEGPGAEAGTEGRGIDGFVGPGHVSTVIGLAEYEFVAEEFGRPIVVCGFEPVDVLHAVLGVVEQLADGRAAVENRYSRVVPDAGNPTAMSAIDTVFECRPHFEWRGLGSLPESAMAVRPAYARFDAEQRFDVAGVEIADPRACQCGSVLQGLIEPRECKVFGTACTPETPIGTCMVSSEGACAAYYTYGRGLEIRTART